jgi:hypothetical protein
MGKKKARCITVEDELWIPFFKKHKSASKRIREMIEEDLKQ